MLKVWWLGRRCRGDRGEGLLVAGRKVLADLALSQDDVRALALDRGTLGKSGADRRNLYLVLSDRFPFPRPLAPAAGPPFWGCGAPGHTVASCFCMEVIAIERLGEPVLVQRLRARLWGGAGCGG